MVFADVSIGRPAMPPFSGVCLAVAGLVHRELFTRQGLGSGCGRLKTGSLLCWFSCLLLRDKPPRQPPGAAPAAGSERQRACSPWGQPLLSYGRRHPVTPLCFWFWGSTSPFYPRTPVTLPTGRAAPLGQSLHLQDP